jgi:hypothetical protein
MVWMACAREALRARSGATGSRYSTKHPTPAWRPPPVAGMLVPGKPIMPAHISLLTGAGFSRNWQAPLAASEVTDNAVAGGSAPHTDAPLRSGAI